MQYKKRPFDELRFDWDPPKSASNDEKHGIAFELAVNVFQDPDHVVQPARETEYGEVRFRVTGKLDDILWTIVFTLRSERIRIISVRRAHEDEARRYGPRKIPG